MLVSPKWQTMWMESQHCSESIMSVPLPAQQAKKVLEDLRINCCSPNKAVQLKALKCWGMWINNQSTEDWKLNSNCFTAVRPLVTKKMQPLHKDVDICKIKVNLMWALLRKVQNLMHLEGPQYILEVFLQSCLCWLSSINGDESEKEVSALIFQLLLSLLKTNETMTHCEKDFISPLTTDILHMKKVFHHLADKFINILVHWRKIPNQNMFLQLWRHFLVRCELSHEHIPIPVWHKVFKLIDQICSEKNETLKNRLAFLHSCATGLNSTLLSSKLIDFGNLLTTPCEALFKKLVELCTVECAESCDSEMFIHSKETCQVLSEKIVAICGFDLCIRVVDVLEDFWLKGLFWGVWCGLVSCFKSYLCDVDRKNLSKSEMKFYRKLRGAAVNLELDRVVLLKDCIYEVEKHIGMLNINCFCQSLFKDETPGGEDSVGKERETATSEPMEVDGSLQLLPCHSRTVCVPNSISVQLDAESSSLFNGRFASVSEQRGKFPLRMTEYFKPDLIQDIFKKINLNSMKSLLGCLYSFRLFQAVRPGDSLLQLKVTLDQKQDLNLTLRCLKANALPPVAECEVVESNEKVMKGNRKADIGCEKDKDKNKEKEKKKRRVVRKKMEEKKEEEKEKEKEEEEEVISIPETRSRRRADEEKKKELESQRRKKRKSFEVIVQEIVRKNKERKTEKNGERKSLVLRGKKRRKKMEKSVNENKRMKTCSRSKSPEVCERRLRHSKKEEPKIEKKNGMSLKSLKNEGKLENYFKVITRKCGSQMKKDKKTPRTGKKQEEKARESICCNAEAEKWDKKSENGWRQTSLKVMMNQKKKGEKKGMEMRTRSKTAEAPDGKVKQKENIAEGRSLSKLSPFKKVLHDHEYAIIEFDTLEKALLAKQKVPGENSIDKCTEPASERLAKCKLKLVVDDLCEKEKSAEERKNEESEKAELEESKTPVAKPPEGSEEAERPEKVVEEHLEPEPTGDGREGPETEPSPVPAEVNDVEEANLKEASVELPEEKAPEGRPNQNDVPTVKENSTEDLTPSAKGIKRDEVPESENPPTKKFKLDEEDLKEEKLPVEITEKENLEEKQRKKGKPPGPWWSAAKSEGPPRPSEIMSSRALRMIALVQELTNGGQTPWDSSKVDFQCRRPPNMNTNSRASKMLALLSGNVPEVEVDEPKTKEPERKKTTPNAKTLVSSLKSPNSVKKRRSIRFDDAQNEVVLFQVDTPPSQIHVEKEKRRRVKYEETKAN